MSQRILYLDTAESRCNIALFDGTHCMLHRSVDAMRDQAARIGPEIAGIMQDSGAEYQSLSAIAVHNGPGSYTGLRVSLSIAKGICLATGLPLIAQSGHEWVALSWLKKHPQYCGNVAVLTDARRNDAYVSLFTTSGALMNPPALQTIDHSWMEKVTQAGPVILMGSGASKCRVWLNAFPAVCMDETPGVEDFGPVLMDAYENQRFADLVSVVPLYISPVNITQPRTPASK